MTRFVFNKANSDHFSVNIPPPTKAGLWAFTDHFFSNKCSKRYINLDA